MFAKTVIRQGKKIIELDKAVKQQKEEIEELNFKNVNYCRENLDLIGALDDAQEEFLHILERIEDILTSNNYGRPDIVISKAVAEIRYQKDIIEKDLEKNNESDNTDTIG